jgi:hypothetical protein
MTVLAACRPRSKSTKARRGQGLQALHAWRSGLEAWLQEHAVSAPKRLYESLNLVRYIPRGPSPQTPRPGVV